MGCGGRIVAEGSNGGGAIAAGSTGMTGGANIGGLGSKRPGAAGGGGGNAAG